MQIVSNRDNLHEMLKFIFCKILEKYSKMSSAEFFTKHAKCQYVVAFRNYAMPSALWQFGVSKQYKPVDMHHLQELFIYL